MVRVASNITKPIKTVLHKDLTRFSEDSDYKSFCPVCKEGILLVGRNHVTFEIEPHDQCAYCGQRFFYEDFTQNYLRKVKLKRILKWKI